MSLYNILFGCNSESAVILKMLGLTMDDVGRFRDCFVSGDEICVYTRNGGVNRGCWHESDPEYGSPMCANEPFTKIEDELVEATKEEIAGHPEWTPVNIFVGSKRYCKTGNKTENTYYKCLHPESADCACPGCIITHRLPNHPCYQRDEDDGFDSTYATIYFKFPEEYADYLKKIASKEPFDPDARWAALLESLKTED